jgi:hypothetical protein
MTTLIDVGLVRALFRAEMRALGGDLTDDVTDGWRLYARGVLPPQADVAPKDFVKPGIALRCTDGEVEVRPYVHRVVCRNGAVIAHSGAGRRVDLRATGDTERQLQEVREAIHAAAEPGAFRDFVASMRSARGVRPDLPLIVMSAMRRADLDESTLLDFMERYRRGGALDLFAIGNAMTSLGRDTTDPERRWRREAFGAAIFARVLPPLTFTGARAPVPHETMA